MPASVKVMSWNVESLGDGKSATGTPPTRTEIINFLNLAIRRADADIVGIMELKGGSGAQVGGWLESALNAALPKKTAYRWKRQLSSRQDGGTQEEYLMLWKDSVGGLVLDTGAMPSPSWLPGVVDDNLFAPFFANVKWTAAQKTQLYDALADNGYILRGRFKDRGKLRSTKTWRTGPDQWEELDGMVVPAVTFAGGKVQPPGKPTKAQVQDLGARLHGSDILRFISYGDRSPFVANFLVGKAKAPLTVALLHAPGPQDPTRTQAANIIALSAPLVSASTRGNLLLMGDYNIAATQTNLLARDFGRFTDPTTKKFVFAMTTPPTYQTVFEPIEGAPLNAPDLLPGVQTSLINEFIANNSLPPAALGNTFDKFFFHSGAKFKGVATNPAVANLLVNIASNQGNGVYVAALGQSAFTFFKDFRGVTFLQDFEKRLKTKFSVEDKQAKKLAGQLAAAQKKLASTKPAPPVGSPLRKRVATLKTTSAAATAKANVYQGQLTALGITMRLLTDPKVKAASGIGSALTVYRHAVSDHLPITVTLTV